MVLISFTNIVVDDFHFGKQNPFKRYIYFLTHMHSDHYQGITNGWDYGQIFCSEITKALLLIKFPNIQNVITLPMKTPTEIVLSEKYKVTVTLLDANHCPGSVMILFQGFFGTILHTGDMRFNLSMIPANPILYPTSNLNASLEGCSIPIDEMILDNTYCDPIFKFPDRQRAFEMICEIIDQYKDHRILICVDSVGKEELMIQLAEKYETIIVVNQQRFEMIQSINMRPDLFSTNREDGWIEVISKFERVERLKNKKENCIAITATGWANITGYQMPDKQNYVIPYSLHSNFEEMHQFVRSIKPAILQKVVINRSGKSEKIRNLTSFSQYMVTLHYLKQRGFEFFEKQYTDINRLSKEYSSLMNNLQLQEQVKRDLGLILDDEEQQVANKMNFEEKHKNIFVNKRKLNKGVKLKSPEKNQNFKITQFMKIKKQIENLGKSKENDVINLEKSDQKDNQIDKSSQDPEISQNSEKSSKIIAQSDSYLQQQRLFEKKKSEVYQTPKEPSIILNIDHKKEQQNSDSIKILLKVPKIIKATPVLEQVDQKESEFEVFKKLVNQKIKNQNCGNEKLILQSMKSILDKKL